MMTMAMTTVTTVCYDELGQVMAMMVRHRE